MAASIAAAPANKVVGRCLPVRLLSRPTRLDFEGDDSELIGPDPAIEAAVACETLQAFGLTSGALVLLVVEGIQRARPARLHALTPPSDGTRIMEHPQPGTIYCSPLLLHHLGLAAHGATVAVMTPPNESTMLPPPAAKAVVALVRTPPPDPLLGRADGPNAATLAKALRRHFRRRRVLQVGDTFAVAVRASSGLGAMVRRGVLAPPSPAASELGSAMREAAGGADVSADVSADGADVYGDDGAGSGDDDGDGGGGDAESSDASGEGDEGHYGAHAWLLFQVVGL